MKILQFFPSFLHEFEMKANERVGKNWSERDDGKVSENSIFNWTACCSLNENNEHGKNSSGIKSALRCCQQFSHYDQPENALAAAATAQCMHVNSMNRMEPNWTEQSSSIAGQPHGLAFNDRNVYRAYNPIKVNGLQTLRPLDVNPLLLLLLSSSSSFFVSFCFRSFNLLLYFVSYVYDVMPFHLNYSKLFSAVFFLWLFVSVLFVQLFRVRYEIFTPLLLFIKCICIKVCAQCILHTRLHST